MTNDGAGILAGEDRFLLVTHVNPDGDAIGSVLGMHLALREMGKTSWPVSGEKFPELYGFLPGIEDVVCETQQVAALNPGWIVAMDTATKERISGDIKPFGKKVPVLNIDHHGTNPLYGLINVVDPTATSTAEIVFRLLKKAGYKLSIDVAKCLYTGLVTDTGCFRFSGVNSKTMNLAAELLEPGIDAYEITRFLYEEFPLSRMELEMLVLSRCQILLQGRLVISTLYYEDFNRLAAPLSESENLVDRLRENRGVQVGILMTQVSDNVVRVSFRSKGSVDVASVARPFGGGGHRSAAGLRSTMPLAELKECLVEAVDRALAAG